VFWTRPLRPANHAVRAVRARYAPRKLAERRAELRSAAGATLKMRIGLNTAVVVGNWARATA
jgi:class 3 adenylate cyclase